MTTDEAKAFLKAKGYFVDNLWHVDDVKMLFECTDDQAQEVLDNSLTADNLYNTVWDHINYYAEDLGLKKLILK